MRPYLRIFSEIFRITRSIEIGTVSPTEPERSGTPIS